MRTNGEIAHDAQMVATLRRCADALDAIAGTLAAINEKLGPPVFITPREAIDVVVANPKMNAALFAQQKGAAMKSLNEIVAELRMGDDGGKPAYRIGRADKVEVSMPSGTPVRSYVIEYVTIKELADWIEAAVARERGPGNAAAMREALDEIRVDAMSDYEPGADYLIEKCNAALSAPPRNCDVGTALEQYRRWVHFCEQRLHRCDNCPCDRPEGCTFTFENMPYEAQEGAGE